MTLRSRLPDRRPALTVTVTWSTPSGVQVFDVTAGFRPEDGSLAEVFYADGLRSGTDLQHTISDACVWLSLALQHGLSLGTMGRSLGRTPDGQAASVLGAIAAALAEILVQVRQSADSTFRPIGVLAAELVARQALEHRDG